MTYVPERADKPHNAAASQIMECLRKDTTSEYGLRVIPPELEGSIEKGAEIAHSYKWDNGEWTEEELEGTSAVWIRSHTHEDILDAIGNIGADGSAGGKNGYYFGKNVALIKSNKVCHGEDVGEGLFHRPEIVEIWTKENEGKSELNPRGVAA